MSNFDVYSFLKITTTTNKLAFVWLCVSLHKLCICACLVHFLRLFFFEYVFCLQRFSKFCVRKYNNKVCEDDQREFLNGWYILVIISDVMAIIGSILKMEIQAKVIMKCWLIRNEVCRLTLISIALEEKWNMLVYKLCLM